jgi:hypothetical protein
MGLFIMKSIWMLRGALLNSMLIYVRMKRLFISRGLGFNG